MHNFCLLGIKLFHVDAERSVSTWLMPCTLKVVQILGDDKGIISITEMYIT